MSKTGRSLAWGLAPLWLGFVVVLAPCLVGVLTPASCARPRAIVLYCAQDQSAAEPILAEFTRATGLRVDPVWDSEVVKTVGLANRLLGESSSPRADVWWSNEEFRTRQLAARGVFGTNRVGPGPAAFAASGSRHRCLVYSTAHPPAGPLPASLVELTNARWAGRVSMAFPLFGTTATHLLALRDAWGDGPWRDWCAALAANRPFLEEGNSRVPARVDRGEAWLGLTDSDDLAAAVREGARLAEIPLGPDGLAIPSTVALVRPALLGVPARRLAEYLASEPVRLRLEQAGALDAAAPPAARVPDWGRMVASVDDATRALEGIFRR